LLFKIYTFSRAEKHPSDSRNAKIGEGARLGIQEQGEKVGTVTHIADGKPEEVIHIQHYKWVLTDKL